jgi:ABC-type uncharacterized transport system auxiliary subunit
LVVAEPGASGQAARRLESRLRVRAPVLRVEGDGGDWPVQLLDGRLDRVAGARWSAPLDTALEAALVDTLRDRGGFGAVLGGESAFVADYVLDVEVRTFVARYVVGVDAPTVRVTLAATLGQASSRRVAGALQGQGEVVARANTRTAIAAAFQQATREAVLQVAEGVERLAAATEASR